MIKNIRAINVKNEYVDIDLYHPEKSGFIVKNIEGIMPGQVSINTTPLATTDGGLYNSARKDIRNITITVGLLFTPTVEDTRHKLYKYFNIKEKVTLEFQTDRRYSEITGYVENIDGDIFSEDESPQISIICPDPWFYSKTNEIISFSGIMPVFEFPFLNESVTDNLLEFGEIRLDTRISIIYNGDISTGVTIVTHYLDNPGDIDIFNVDTREHMKLYSDRVKKTTGFIPNAGDDVIISTINGNKYAHLYHEGFYYNILNAIDKESDWFKLTKGDNVFVFNTQHGNEKILMSFQYRDAFGGI